MDNSIHNIQKMIDEKGGDDKEELTGLLEEFKEETGKEIVTFTSNSFYDKISGDYGMSRTDAIEIVLGSTDADYFKRIEADLFDTISDEIKWSGESLIESYSSHIGTEGIEELEVIDHELNDIGVRHH